MMILDTSYKLLLPSTTMVLDEVGISLLAATLITRSMVVDETSATGAKPKRGKHHAHGKPAVTRVKALLRNAEITEWGKVWRVDSEEGDTMCSAGLGD
jgi:hypothetical protein